MLEDINQRDLDLRENEAHKLELNNNRHYDVPLE